MLQIPIEPWLFTPLQSPLAFFLRHILYYIKTSRHTGSSLDLVPVFRRLLLCLHTRLEGGNTRIPPSPSSLSLLFSLSQPSDILAPVSLTNH